MGSDNAPRESGDRGCPKCGRMDVAVESLSMADGILSNLTDIPTDQFSVVSCRNCGYSELYRETDSETISPHDLFLG